MATTTKKATASAVSKALVAGGLTKSETHRSGQIRGWSESSSGFKCEQGSEATGEFVDKVTYRRGTAYARRDPVYANNGIVTVSWTEGSFRRSQDRSAEMLGAAAEVLRAKGYDVEVDKVGAVERTVLKVTRPQSAADVKEV